MPEPINGLAERRLEKPAPFKPHKPVPPEKNPHRWIVPDRACISEAMPVRSDEEKKNFKIVVDLVSNSLFVVDKSTGKAVDAYLTSPGERKHPTKGNSFKITKVMPMSWWNPPPADWAKNDKPTPPGLNSPTGILKLNLGQYGQYIHGTPARNEKQLGRAVSHGCLRMSNDNVVHLYQNYATVGTVVEINRKSELSKQLKSDLAVAGVSVHDLRDGHELVQPLIDSCGPNQ